MGNGRVLCLMSGLSTELDAVKWRLDQVEMNIHCQLDHRLLYSSNKVLPESLCQYDWLEEHCGKIVHMPFLLK